MALKTTGRVSRSELFKCPKDGKIKTIKGSKAAKAKENAAFWAMRSAREKHRVGQKVDWAAALSEFAVVHKPKKMRL